MFEGRNFKRFRLLTPKNEKRQEMEISDQLMSDLMKRAHADLTLMHGKALRAAVLYCTTVLYHVYCTVLYGEVQARVTQNITFIA